MIKDINQILLISEFNDPPLSFNIHKYEDRKVQYIRILESNKNSYIIPNNNNKDLINCIIILSPPYFKKENIISELQPICLIVNNEQIQDNKNLPNNSNQLFNSLLNNYNTNISIPVNNSLLLSQSNGYSNSISSNFKFNNSNKFSIKDFNNKLKIKPNILNIIKIDNN
jgi:hypothetical protein